MVEDSQNASVVMVEEVDLLLTTCHKAKGMEWENVLVAGDFADLIDDAGRPLPVGTAANPPICNRKPIRFVERDEVNVESANALEWRQAGYRRKRSSRRYFEVEGLGDERAVFIGDFRGDLHGPCSYGFASQLARRFIDLQPCRWIYQ